MGDADLHSAAFGGQVTDRQVSGDRVDYRWRGDASDAELVALVEAHGGHSEAGWWDQIRPFSLGWVTARLPSAELVGFVNVAWDGGDHAFLIDTKVASRYQRRGIATELVAEAVRQARQAGCEWIHVDWRLSTRTSAPA